MRSIIWPTRYGAPRPSVPLSSAGTRWRTKPICLQRVKDQLGSLYAGVFDAMDKDSSWPAVQQGIEAARAVGADLLIAIGGGSVIVGTRAVAILLAERATLMP